MLHTHRIKILVAVNKRFILDNVKERKVKIYLIYIW